MDYNIIISSLLEKNSILKSIFTIWTKHRLQTQHELTVALV